MTDSSNATNRSGIHSARWTVEVLRKTSVVRAWLWLMAAFCLLGGTGASAIGPGPFASTTAQIDSYSGGTSISRYTASTVTATAANRTLAHETIRGSDFGGGVGGVLYSVDPPSDGTKGSSRKTEAAVGWVLDATGATDAITNAIVSSGHAEAIVAADVKYGIGSKLEMARDSTAAVGEFIAPISSEAVEALGNGEFGKTAMEIAQHKIRSVDKAMNLMQGMEAAASGDALALRSPTP